MKNGEPMSEMNYRIAGSVVAPSSLRLVEALAVPGFNVRDKGGEVLLRQSTFSASIYDSGMERTGGSEFLVSGSFHGDLAALRSVLSEIVTALRAHGLTFELEVQDDQGEELLVLRDEPAGGDDKAERRSLSVTFNASGSPESPYGRERLQLRDDGRLRYERWFAADHIERTVRATGGATSEVFAALDASTFPDVAKHNIPPGASLVEIQVEDVGGARLASLHLYKGLTFPGYGDVLRRMTDWATALRQPGSELPPDLRPAEENAAGVSP
jgi:hypothetical protein